MYGLNCVPGVDRTREGFGPFNRKNVGHLHDIEHRCDARCDWNPFFKVSDRWGKACSETGLSEPLGEFCKSVDGAGHGDGSMMTRDNLCQAVGAIWTKKAMDGAALLADEAHAPVEPVEAAFIRLLLSVLMGWAWLLARRETARGEKEALRQPGVRWKTCNESTCGWISRGRRRRWATLPCKPARPGTSRRGTATAALARRRTSPTRSR